MNIRLAEFQMEALRRLLGSLADARREVVLKSCTGSGKTLILTHFIDEAARRDPEAVFVWLTPGRGELEEQSRAKMELYIPQRPARLLEDVMAAGFEAGDACFINWERLTMKGNNALRESEHLNFRDRVSRARQQGLHFIVLVDEAHQNDTVRAVDILELFEAVKIVRCSATPRPHPGAQLIEVPEEDVIEAGLIKRLLIINEDFSGMVSVRSQAEYLVSRAVEKQRELTSAFRMWGEPVNPLIVIQVPNRSDKLIADVESQLALRGITAENGRLAVWLHERKENLAGIERIDAAPEAILIKQAVATGWDCPRAYVLVKLRENMGDTFELQTIGRIRRMPQARHYGSDLLDSCYLYTLDEKFTEGVRRTLGRGALDAMRLYLRPEFARIRLRCEQKPSVPLPRDAAGALKTLARHYTAKYRLGQNAAENERLLRAAGYVLSDEIVRHTASGAVRALTPEEFERLRQVDMLEPLNTHTHGRDFLKRTGELGVLVGLEYQQVGAILRRLFDKTVRWNGKLLHLDTRGLYALVLNNFPLLRADFREALSDEGLQTAMWAPPVREVEFRFPSQTIFTFNGKLKGQREYKKNVYAGYLSSAEVRSASEKAFERYCELSERVEWFYKNGDRGNEYFSVVYEDNFHKQRSFYPDYLVGTPNGIYVIETKGGFDRTGRSEDIDPFSPLKFDVLKSFLARSGLRGGFVRRDMAARRLCVCTDRYSDDIRSGHWRPLSELF